MRRAEEEFDIAEDFGPEPEAEDTENRIEESAEGTSDGPSVAGVAVPEEPEAELDPLTEAERQRDEYLDLARRTQAEFENYRKRMVAEVSAATERGKGELASGLVGVLDNLERALEAVEIAPEAALDGAEVEGALEQGMVLTYRELRGALAKAGVEGLDPEGERFDPTWHEAIQSMPTEEQESGTVVQVLQKGYRIGDRVLRPARVIVSA